MVSYVGERQFTAQNDTVLDFFGSKIHLKLTADDTGGAYSLVEYDAAPRFEGPPMHIHSQTSEYIYVLDGKLTMTLGSRQYELGPGEGLLVPPGAPHTFGSQSDERVRFLNMFSPGGFEGFLAEAADLAVRDEWPPEPETIFGMLDRYDMIVAQE